MTIILGGTGYVGSSICRYFDKVGEPYRILSRADIDYGHRDSLVKAIRDLKPGFLINAAGYTGKPNVDACETDRAACLAGNAVLPGIIREACEVDGIPWGHVSSGCIFTGRRDDGGGFIEGDAPNFSFRANNCSFYSGTKALGEEVLVGAKNCYIWRLRIPFDHRDGPRNYLTKLLRYDRLLDAENSVTQLDEFARVCHDCIVKEVPYGTYNVTNTGSITTREVVELIRKYLDPSKDFCFFESEDEFMRIAANTPRSNCVLDNSKLRKVGIEITPVREAIVMALKKWVEESFEETAEIEEWRSSDVLATQSSANSSRPTH